MTLVLDPPGWDPDEVNMKSDETLSFETSDSSSQTIEIQPPPPGIKSDLTIPADWTPPAIGGYRVIYNYKGGATTGHVNVTVGSGDGKVS